MSYDEHYFDQIPEWEDSFDRVIVHGDLIKRGTGSTTGSTLVSYEKGDYDINPVQVSSDIIIDAKDIYSGIEDARPISAHEEGHHSGTGGYMVRVRVDGYDRIMYDPISETMLIPDIYHTITEYTEEFRTLCQKLQNNIFDLLETHDESPQIAYINGDAYRLRKVHNPNYKSNLDRILGNIRDSYEHALNRIRERNNQGLQVDRSIADSLGREGITLYQTDGDAYAYKKIEYTVDEITDEGSVWPMGLPENLQVHDKATVRVQLSRNNIGQGMDYRWEHISSDTPHIHRRGGTGSGFKGICNGTLSHIDRNITTVSDLVDLFDKVKKAMKTINVSSPYTSDLNDRGYDKYAPWNEYTSFLRGEKDGA